LISAGQSDERNYMPQLKHLARFTTPVNLNNDAKDTPINTKTNINTTVNAAVYHILTHATQPMSVIEITEAASRYSERPFGEMHVRTQLKDLMEKRLVSGRKETREEHILRGDGKRMSTILATLYWAPAGPVPARTVAEVVPGVKLYSETGTPARKVYKYPTKKIQRQHLEAQLVEITPVTTASASNSNSVVDYLIEKMVAERTAEIQSQLDAANAKLAKLQELFKSAL
jgi:hypothetical protein